MKEEIFQVESKVKNILLIIACAIIIIAGIKAASSILITILLSLFITIVCAPPFLWLGSKGIPKSLAITIIILTFLLIAFLIGLLVGTSVADFTLKLPQYQSKLESQMQLLLEWLKNEEIIEPDFKITNEINPGSILVFVGNTLNQLSGLFADIFLIAFIVVFMLLEASSFPLKLNKILKESTEKMRRIEVIYHKINRYIGIKTIISAITGILVYIVLLIIGVDYALLWGVLAFALNYIPNIGSILAAIPPLLLTIIQLGFWEALWVLVAYILINTIMGNIIEPKFMGKGLGLSTLVVFISLIFWGWLLGPMGMLLSIPLTIAVKIILDSSEETRWLGILLGPERE
jgi:predicted PurR-regulated permease PerM